MTTKTKKILFYDTTLRDGSQDEARFFLTLRLGVHKM